MNYPISVEVTAPGKMSRLTTFFRFFMVLPHYVVLNFVGIAAGILVFLSWWVILFTGTYPRGFFDFVAGYLRWYTRVGGYYLLLTDQYPPFSLR
jgi:hypothetical protein